MVQTAEKFFPARPWGQTVASIRQCKSVRFRAYQMNTTVAIASTGSSTALDQTR
jgi:hypothetical protein